MRTRFDFLIITGRIVRIDTNHDAADLYLISGHPLFLGATAATHA